MEERLYRDVMRWQGSRRKRQRPGKDRRDRRERRDRRDRKAWIAEIRSNPKQAMEADLGVAGAGLAIFVFGGVVAVAGYHPKWQNIHSNAPAPLLGNIIAGVGLVIGAVGLVLLVVSLVVWIGGKVRRRSE
jgi:hypothetical protein